MTVDQILAPLDSFDVRSRDGTRIRAHRAGTGPHHWLLTPGMGTPLLCFKHIFEAFQDQMTIVTWDQRGTYDSERPRRLGDLAFERHVEDGLAVLEALEWEGPFVTGSWSMGVQLGLTIYDRMPERIAGLALINGAFEHVLRTAYGPAITAPILRAFLRGSMLASPLTGPLARGLFRSGAAGRLMDRLGVSTDNREFVIAVTKELSRVDLRSYLQILLELDRHSARDVLPKVRVPTLVTAGSDDVATPPSVARDMSFMIPDSEYFEITNGTHYTPLEYPSQLNAALERFFRTRVFPETWRADAG